jgi:hypothetical protein
MKKAYPTRKKDRRQHALLRPLSSRTPFATLELIRVDLLEYLDKATFGAWDDEELRLYVADEIQQIADRLKELTPIMARRLRPVLRPDRPFDLLEAAPLPQWDARQEYWASVAR